MELLCLGDSLTFGYGVAPRERWTSLTAQKSGWRVGNRGVCGDTTGGMLARLRGELLSAPDAVLIMGGANDVFYSGSDRSARANMGAMLHQALASGAVPLAGISAPIVPGACPAAWADAVDFEASSAILEEYCAWLISFCRAFGLRCVDFRPDFLDAKGKPDAALYIDGLHPGPEGHRRMAERLASALKALEGELNRG